jgi:hypothetical protein
MFPLNFEVHIKKIASPKIRLTTEIPTYGYNKSPSKHPKKTPPTWLLPPTIATSHHCPLRFRHAETMVKGTEMGYATFCRLKSATGSGHNRQKHVNDASCLYRANK